MCYNQYICANDNLKVDGVNSAGNGMEDVQTVEVSEKSFQLFEKKVIFEKEAYLLTELLIDIEEMSYDAGLEEPIISKTFTLRNRLEYFFSGKIGYEKVNSKLLVYPLDINPCFYIKKKDIRRVRATKCRSHKSI